jgi:hypothetical protein
MKNFVRTSGEDILFFAIRAVNKNNDTISMHPFQIKKKYSVFLYISKNNVVTAEKFELVKGLKISSFSIVDYNFFDAKDTYIESDNDKYTQEMKLYIQNASVGSILRFRVNYLNVNGKMNTKEMQVQVVL